jgi:hypothetical protein
LQRDIIAAARKDFTAYRERRAKMKIAALTTIAMLVVCSNRG